MNRTKNRRGRSGSSRGGRDSYSNYISRSGSFNSRGPSRHGAKAGRGGSQGRGGRNMPTFDPSKFINTNPVDAVEIVYEPKHGFRDFGLNEQLLKNIAPMGLREPTPIQDQIIPEVLNGRDVIGIAETGTGKTAAFLIPIIENTLKNPDKQTLVLAPTHELAIQIGEELRKLVKGFRIFFVICVGGTNIRFQIKDLRNKNQFIIGTPGRVMDLIERKCIKPQDITTVVLDEADRMLDMGFIKDMRKILSKIPKSRETLFFSATMTGDARQLVNDFMRDPITISVKKKDVIDSIEQDVVSYVPHNKFETLSKLLSNPEFKRVLIFGAMKHSVEKLSRKLSDNGIKTESIHGNKSHPQRKRALERFKTGQVRVLVATDVAARGIHVDNVTHVINYDLPSTFEDYVHRIGRTGRAKRRGKAITFVQGSSRAK